MNRRILSMMMIFACLLGGSLALARTLGHTQEATDYIREFCKQKAKVSLYIIYSGPATKDVAEDLRSLVLRHSDRNEKSFPDNACRLFPLSDLEGAMREKEFATGNQVYLIATEDLSGPISSSVEREFPGRISSMADQDSVIESIRHRDTNQGLAHKVMMVAPDRERVQRLFQGFLDIKASRWNEMEIKRQTYQSNRLVIYAPAALHSKLTEWGKLPGSVWNDIVVKEAPGEEHSDPRFLRGRNELYLVQRSSNMAVPAEAAGILRDQSIDTTSLFYGAQDLEGNRRAAVFSSPTLMHLETMIRRYRLLSAVPSQERVDLTDARWIGDGPMVVAATGGGLAQNVAEDIRSSLESTLRQQLNFKINPRGQTLMAVERELTIQQLQGKSETAERLIKEGVRYLWLLELQTPRGGSTYDSSESSSVSDPGPFMESEPRRPGNNAKSSEWDYYREALRSWSERKEQNERMRYVDPVSWSRNVYRSTTVQIGGTLHLIDLSKGSGTLVLSMPANGSASTRTVHQSDRVTVQGAANKPDSLPAPPSDEVMPVPLLIDSGKSMATLAMRSLVDATLFWQPGMPVDIEVVAKPPVDEVKEEKPVTTTPPKTGPVNSQVQRVANGRVIVAPPDSLWSEGDLLEARQESPKLIVRLKVQSIEGSYVICVPARTSDKNQLSKLKSGARVVFFEKGSS